MRRVGQFQHGFADDFGGCLLAEANGLIAFRHGVNVPVAPPNGPFAAIVTLVQSRAPDIGRCHMRWNPSLRLLGEPDIIAGRLDPILMEFGVTRMRQDLINAAARHDVTAEKNTDDLVRI